MQFLSRCFFVALTILLLSPVECWRVKRRLDAFGEMILLTCDRNPLEFNGYGNYCGFGGSGTPVDDLDRCCQTHDRCYVKLNRKECSNMLKYKVYTTEYKWSFKKGTITCSEGDLCAKELCECDKAAAICFSENEHLYDPENKHASLVSGISKLLGMDFKS